MGKTRKLFTPTCTRQLKQAFVLPAPGWRGLCLWTFFVWMRRYKGNTFAQTIYTQTSFHAGRYNRLYLPYQQAPLHRFPLLTYLVTTQPNKQSREHDMPSNYENV
jgi:hypothetical protein